MIVEMKCYNLTMKKVLLFLVYLSFSNPIYAKWNCEFTDSVKSTKIYPSQNKFNFTINGESFDFVEYYNFQNDPKAIEYKLQCHLKNQTCSGSKTINSSGQKKVTNFIDTQTSKGNEIREFNQIRYFLKMSSAKFTLQSTHKNKIIVECSNEKL